ncbi:MAG: hypothetical protein QXQ43_06775 [Nitrososphaerota archaeon]
MNDYCKGALEALFWVNTILSKNPDDVKREINEAISDLYNGIALDFRERIRRGL